MNNFKDFIDSRLQKYETFRIIKHYSKTSNIKLAAIIRNLPVNFGEKNYICLLADISYKNYIISSSIDSLFRVTFYVFVGSTLEDMEEFLDHRKMIKKLNWRIFFYLFIFLIFMSIEACASIYGYI